MTEKEKLQRKLNRLIDKEDAIVGKGVGINLAIKMLTRKDKELTKEWGKTMREIEEVRKQLKEMEKINNAKKQ